MGSIHESFGESRGFMPLHWISRDTVEAAHIDAGHQKQAGWAWDKHLNGFVSQGALQRFACTGCGSELETPGYQNCKCGKIWNTYSLESRDREAGAPRYITREIPVRPNVMLASRDPKTDNSGHGGMESDTGLRGAVRGVGSRQGSQSASHGAEEWPWNRVSAGREDSEADFWYAAAADGDALEGREERHQGSAHSGDAGVRGAVSSRTGGVPLGRRLSEQSANESSVRNALGEHARPEPERRESATAQAGVLKGTQARRAEFAQGRTQGGEAAMPLLRASSHDGVAKRRGDAGAGRRELQAAYERLAEDREGVILAGKQRTAARKTADYCGKCISEAEAEDKLQDLFKGKRGECTHKTARRTADDIGALNGKITIEDDSPHPDHERCLYAVDEKGNDLGEIAWWEPYGYIHTFEGDEHIKAELLKAANAEHPGGLLMPDEVPTEHQFDDVEDELSANAAQHEAAVRLGWRTAAPMTFTPRRPTKMVDGMPWDEHPDNTYAQPGAAGWAPRAKVDWNDEDEASYSANLAKRNRPAKLPLTFRKAGGYHHDKDFASEGKVYAYAQDGRKVGALNWHPHQTDGEPEIGIASVHPEFQKQGIGLAMLDHVRDNYAPRLRHSSQLSLKGHKFAMADAGNPEPEATKATIPFDLEGEEPYAPEEPYVPLKHGPLEWQKGQDADWSGWNQQPDYEQNRNNYMANPPQSAGSDRRPRVPQSPGSLTVAQLIREGLVGVKIRGPFELGETRVLTAMEDGNTIGKLIWYASTNTVATVTPEQGPIHDALVGHAQALNPELMMGGDIPDHLQHDIHDDWRDAHRTAFRKIAYPQEWRGESPYGYFEETGRGRHPKPNVLAYPDSMDRDEYRRRHRENAFEDGDLLNPDHLIYKREGDSVSAYKPGENEGEVGEHLGNYSWEEGDDYGTHPHIHVAQVNPAYQGQGVAGGILDHIREHYEPNLVHSGYQDGILSYQGRAGALNDWGNLPEEHEAYFNHTPFNYGQDRPWSSRSYDVSDESRQAQLEQHRKLMQQFENDRQHPDFGGEPGRDANMKDENGDKHEYGYDQFGDYVGLEDGGYNSDGRDEHGRDSEGFDANNLNEKGQTPHGYTPGWGEGPEGTVPMSEMQEHYANNGLSSPHQEHADLLDEAANGESPTVYAVRHPGHGQRSPADGSYHIGNGDTVHSSLARAREMAYHPTDPSQDQNIVALDNVNPDYLHGSVTGGHPEDWHYAPNTAGQAEDYYEDLGASNEARVVRDPQRLTRAHEDLGHGWEPGEESGSLQYTNPNGGRTGRIQQEDDGRWRSITNRPFRNSPDNAWHLNHRDAANAVLEGTQPPPGHDITAMELNNDAAASDHLRARWEPHPNGQGLMAQHPNGDLHITQDPEHGHWTSHGGPRGFQPGDQGGWRLPIDDWRPRDAAERAVRQINRRPFVQEELPEGWSRGDSEGDSPRYEFDHPDGGFGVITNRNGNGNWAAHVRPGDDAPSNRENRLVNRDDAMNWVHENLGLPFTPSRTHEWRDSAYNGAPQLTRSHPQGIGHVQQTNQGSWRGSWFPDNQSALGAPTQEFPSQNEAVDWVNQKVPAPAAKQSKINYSRFVVR